MTTERLQMALTDLGFDPGPVDGAMGPLTQLALARFQRAYRLRADGCMSPETLRLLRTELPRCRRLVCVGQHSSLVGLAAEVGVMSHALVEANRHKARDPVYPDEKLTVYRRAVIQALVGPGDLQLSEGRGRFTRVLVPLGRLAGDGGAELEPLVGGEALSADWPAGGPAMGVVELGGPARTQRLAVARAVIAAAARWGRAPLAGVVLRDVGLDLEGAVFMAQLASVLARIRRRSHLKLELGAWIQLPDAGRHVDLEELAQHVDWVMAELRETAGSWELLSDAARKAPRWKLVAGIDLRPYHIEDGKPVRMEWRDFSALRKRHVMRESVDLETRLRQFAYRSKGRVRRMFTEDRGSLARVLHEVNALNMLGVAFIGMPPDSAWVTEEMLKKFIPM